MKVARSPKEECLELKVRFLKVIMREESFAKLTFKHFLFSPKFSIFHCRVEWKPLLNIV